MNLKNNSNIKMAVVMDPLESINIKKDSTYSMLKEAHKRNWNIYTLTPHDIHVLDNIPYGNITEIEILENQNNHNKWYNKKSCITTKLNSIDIILIRKDPPFNMEYIYLTYLLDLAQEQGVLIANNPTAIRNNNEKLSILQFPSIIPPSIITANKINLLNFLEEHKTIIVKPLDGMGGQSIFKIKYGDDNTSVILDTITHYGTTTILAQLFIKEINKGDKRNKV